MWYNGEADVNKKEIRELQQLAVVKKQNHEVEPVWMSEETRSTQVFWDQILSFCQQYYASKH